MLSARLLSNVRVWLPRAVTAATSRCIATTDVTNAVQVKMPSLSPTMTEGTIVKWNKKEGDAVNTGEVLCEIQTDKAVVALEADEDGTVAKIILNQDSGSIQIGTLIAVLAEGDEDWKTVGSQFAAGGDGGAAKTEAESAPVGSSTAASGGSTPGMEVKMPSLSPTMTEGTIVKWCKKEGEKISAGEVLCEIQTDKAVVSMEWDEDAVLAKILLPEGEAGVQVGRLIAMLVNEGDDWKDVQIPAQAGAAGQAAPAKSDKKPQEAASARVGEHHFEHAAKAGPATNLLMAQYGIKPDQVTPTGPKGLLKSDVLKFIQDGHLQPIKVEEASKAQAKTRQKEKVSKAPAGTPYTDHPVSSMRAVIAKRLTESKQNSPHGHTTVAANADAILQLRKDFASVGIKLSVNDFIIKAAGTALQYVPEINMNIKGDDFQIMPNVDISVAVATDTGLITPIVTNVPSKSLEQISKDVQDLAKRARDGKLKLNEFQGGTFSISNLGMFGISEFTAIINPPQAAILSVGSGFPEINPHTGKSFNSMKMTLNFDRRFVDEALAADFMHTLQKILERPEFMNVGFVPIVRRDRKAESYT